MRVLILCLLIVGIFFLLPACVPRLSNPLSKSDELITFRTDPENKNVLIYHNPHHRITNYSKFMIDSVKIYSNELREIKPADQTLLADSLRTALIGVLQDKYTIVDKAGPDVLRIRIAILDLQPARVELDEQKFLVLRLDTLLARVQMELECVDAVTGERIAALIYHLREQEYIQPGATKRMISIKEAFSDWVMSLGIRFDAAKAKSEKAFEGIEPKEHRRLRFEEGE
jgi:Protein of unknown function (DUF3313)